MTRMPPLPARLRKWLRRGPRVAVVRLHGQIAPGGRGLSDAATAEMIEAAFAGKPAAVALSVNSPGGAPVQSALIAARIRRLADRHEVPVHAFAEDVAASGGYWLACAGDFIWADDSSLVGSIGVVTAGFGAHELLGRVGVDRRVHATGPRKAMLDPFRPERAEDVAELRDLQGEIFEAFKAQVRARRGDRLGPEQTLFTGAVWTGRRAAALGLVDGIAHLVPKMTELFGDEVRFRVFAPRRGLLGRFGLAGSAPGADAGADLGAGLTAGALRAAEDRLAWARHGL